MGEHEREECQPVATGAESPAEVVTDRGRRKFTAAGLAGTGVLMTLSNRSALGASLGQCGSESVSAALSRQMDLPECGCSPGFWWNPNGERVWRDYIEPAYPQYARSASFNQVFCTGLPVDVPKFFKDDATTLWDARKAQNVFPPSNYDECANIHAIAMHAVAALLNVAFYGNRYPAVPTFDDPTEVIAALQAAMQGHYWMNGGETSGPVCTALTAFKNRVDVYNNLWCFNGNNWGE
ncbi:MAG TPA: hypothetical protein PK725_01275 [Rhodocyclaceae bacterium]|nr:hypothetical protein [Rhodocyclaceae bacterium]HRQ45546.1 hypothetical protein [Rhodocyclaceae bacterium]